ncbi:MAG: hypothetical protein QXU18_07090 [Thermoplasmatales archaeon]
MVTTALPNQIDPDVTQWSYPPYAMDEEIKLLLVMDRENNSPLFLRRIPEGMLNLSPL